MNLKGVLGVLNHVEVNLSIFLPFEDISIGISPLSPF